MRYFLLLILCLLASCSKKAPEAPQAKPLFVKVENAQTGATSQAFETAGELKADKEILVAAERQGMIEEIYVYEGKQVQVGDALLKIEGKDVDADLKKAQSDYASYQNLFEQGAISKQELVNYEAQLKRVESLRDNLKVHAISSGLVGVIYVDPGDYVKQGDKILDLVKIHPLRVSYSVPERLIPKIALGQTVELRTDSEPNTIFKAKVDFISPRVDPASRTVLVRAKITNPSYKLKANQFVRVKQIVNSSAATLLFREEAIYLDQGQEFLYLAESGEGLIAKRVPIKTGHREDGRVEILEGIVEGDAVIYAGLHSIYPGAKLVLVEND